MLISACVSLDNMGFRGRVPKRYGQSKSASCPFCGAMAIAKNEDGLSVCMAHKKSSQKDETSGLNDIKCKCNSFLELKSGKYGMYFNCLTCGNIKYEVGMELKEKQDALKVGTDKEDKRKKFGSMQQKTQKKWPARKKVTERRSKFSGKQEIVITCRDMEWFD